MMPTNTENVPVKELDCDTIGQVKEICLDTIYRIYHQVKGQDVMILIRNGVQEQLVVLYYMMKIQPHN